MTDRNAWDGKAKGSTLGNFIFIKIISALGPFPAYILCIIVAFHYAIFDREGIDALCIFRKKLGLKSTHLWHLFRHFYSFGMALIDRVTFLVRKNPPFKYTYINEDYISNTLNLGKGVILLSAHIGNWDVAGNLLFDRLYKCINIIMLDNERRDIKSIYNSITEKRRFKTIEVSKDGMNMMISVRRALKNNEIVCFHGDRVFGSTGAILTLFGGDARFPDGPFRIAAITGAPIIPVFTMKTGMRHYTFIAYSPITFNNISDENRNNLIRQAMESYISVLEDVVRKYPYQWFNFHNVWKVIK